jgi:SAM-dependent methyltransferase
MTVVDLGGGVSGFQFTVADAGAMVTNIDPFVDYGSVVAYETIDPVRLIDRLNAIYRTEVRLMRQDLVGAALPSASVDVVYCISMLEHLTAQARADALHEVRRILRPGGHLVVTVDLFLDLEPFTDRESNRYGTNIDLKEVVEQSGLTLVVGERDALLGYPEFEAKRVQSRLADFLIGVYPALTECFVLRQS